MWGIYPSIYIRLWLFLTAIFFENFFPLSPYHWYCVRGTGDCWGSVERMGLVPSVDCGVSPAEYRSGTVALSKVYGTGFAGVLYNEHYFSKTKKQH